MIFNDKYILTSAAIILVIVALCVLTSETEISDNGVTGIVTDVYESNSGNVFYVTDTEGTVTKCFTSSAISIGDVCTVSGSYSDDRTILFVSKLILR